MANPSDSEIETILKNAYSEKTLANLDGDKTYVLACEYELKFLFVSVVARDCKTL